ncbi:MAG: NosD domain-containing protein, partial [Bacteroidota bacterium]|nr:NosD domain-containing protein [Bacteroidota bacterium]
IPDQIDGCAYDDLFGTVEECCYVDLYTPANDAMQGVQIQINGDDRDIIIQSGNNVTWTATSNSFGNITEAFMEKGDIIIEPDASLTIEDMIIHFREGYEIQMDDNPSGVGSRLTLDNTTLTVFDECEGDKLWAGIDLKGGWGGQLQIPYSSSKQPYLKMLNNSKIKFAVKGVDAAAGGLVRAYNSDFINNIVSVSITNYSDQHSYFQNCDFIWDDAIYAKNETPSIHLHMWTASGVRSTGCDFINNASFSETYPNRGVGIIADYTDFELEGICLNPTFCTNYQRNNFLNLYYGIKTNASNNILIDRCDFTENQRGAWIISSPALQFTRNDIDLFDNHGSLHDESSFGLFLESCTGYQVEENTFRDGALGLVVYNSGEDENLVYLNDFDNIQNPSEQGTSIVTMGLNCESTSKKMGLQYICNQFENYDYAITITGGSLTTSSGVVNVDNSYIRHEQGCDISPYLQRGADNLFGMLNSPINSEADFYVDDNIDPWTYVYYQHTDNMSNFDNYLRYYWGNVIPTTNGTFTTRAQECPSNLSSGGIIIITPIRNSLNDKEAEQDSLKTAYNALLADVNELELVIAAQTTTEGNQQAVHNSLIKVSPNLTDTILSSYLMNNNANELSRTSVMIANSPLPSSVKENVEISNLSLELKYYISQYQTGVNRLENLENKIQMAKAARQYLTDRLQLEYVHNGSEEMQTEWLEYLETKTDLHSKLKLTDMYIKQNQFNDAENLLANIESMLIGTENTEKLKQVIVKQISLAVRQNPQNTEIPASDLNYLYDLAEDYSNKSGGDARAILMASGLESYEPIVILPNPNQEKSAIADNSHENIERPSITPELESRFNIFPNPVNDKLSVEFISMSESCDFVVYDMNGKIVQQTTRNEALGYF